MIFSKRVLANIEKCYAVLGLIVDGKPSLVYGGEGKGSLQVFSGDNFQNCQTIWDGGGGTMSIVPLKGKNGWFLASRGFYSMVEAQDSIIEIIRYKEGVYRHQKIAELPYLHRFDIVTAPDNTSYIVAASIARYKENKEDWSHPGQLFYAELPKNLCEHFTVDMIPLPGTYTMNHGYCKGVYKGLESAFISCKEGVFVVLPPVNRAFSWEIQKLMNQPVSDIAVIDIDGDGEDEIAAIMPFHGNQYKIFKLQNNEYCEIYSYPTEHDFYHVVVGAHIQGTPVFIGGGRKLAMQLFGITWNKHKKSFENFVIDEGIGPSNAAILNTEKHDYILSANRQISQAAVYICNK